MFDGTEVLPPRFEKPWLQEARACERLGAGSVQEEPLPANALYIADCAYFPFKTMKALSDQKVWWLTHARADLMFTDDRGVKSSLTQYLQQQNHGKQCDVWIRVGGTSATRQRVRLLVWKVSDETAQRRRNQANAQSATRGKGSRRNVRVGRRHQRPSNDGRHRRQMEKKRLALSEWTIILTNVPVQQLAAHEARAFMRCRWQIELVWRLWKERG